MKKRVLLSLLAAVLITIFLAGCTSAPYVTLAPLQEPEELSQVLADYHAILDEAMSSDELYSVGLGTKHVMGDAAVALLTKLNGLELEPDYGDPIPQDEGYRIRIRYDGGWIYLGVINEEQIDIYYYNTREDNHVPRYRLKILNRAQGEEVCNIAENFREWEDVVTTTEQAQ